MKANDSHTAPDRRYLCLGGKSYHLVLVRLGDGSYTDPQRVGQNLVLEHCPDDRSRCVAFLGGTHIL